MAIEVKKRDHETTRSLLRRFFRVVQQSKVLVRARKVRFREREKSKRERRESALRRKGVILEKERLRKMGLLGEEPTKKWRKR